MIGVKINSKKDMSITNRLESFYKMDMVYIPVEGAKVLVKKNDKVLMGERIAVSNNGIYHFASVSGKVVDVVKMRNMKNKEIDCIKIKNDFKEEKIEEYDNDNFARYSKENFIESIKNAGIIGLGGAGFPTYLKYNTTEDINTLIINAVECEPYITADYTTSLKHINEILKTLQTMIQLFDIESCYIGVKKKNYRLRELFVTAVAKFPKIKVVDVPNLYPMGWERSLVRYIKHVDYDKIPLEKGIVVSNISTIYAIYEALRYQKPLYEHVVTFTGEGFKNPKNLIVRTGTKVGDILNTLKVDGDDIDFSLVAGGPMMGEAISDDNLVIESSLNCILLLPTKEEKETTCLRCGKCVDNCPVKICPVLVKDNINDLDDLKRLYPNRCIECGICSFICPAKINLREYVRKAKEKCREEVK